MIFQEIKKNELWSDLNAYYILILESISHSIAMIRMALRSWELYTVQCIAYNYMLQFKHILRNSGN
ncbi:hypothetical protein C0J52_09521 [Blattella germanica]|nr:hypothetical protein C0J52_09521 [Blattella germanica]